MPTLLRALPVSLLHHFLTPFAACCLVLGFSCGVTHAAGSPSSPRRATPLSLDERVAAQKAIEEVLWQHRIWPRENPGPKPPLSAVLSDVALRAKIIDGLKKSAALQTLWNRPIQPDQLQAEMRRMAGSTHQPDILRELFSALHDDPTLIAECLARPALADRLVRTAYAGDDRFQGELRKQARNDLARFNTPDRWKEAGGRYRETTWRRSRDGRTEPSIDIHVLSSDDYQGLLSEIASRVDPPASTRNGTAARLPIGRAGPLVEDDASLSVTAVLQQDQDSIRVGSLVWEKTPFDLWWKKTRTSISEQIAGPEQAYEAVTIQTASCTDDSWSPTGASHPEARYYHSAVWTGTEMIVWGGRIAGNGQTSSGARYDPVLDLWTPTFDDRNPAHVPAAREHHNAVWTGTRMIVWGGLSNVGGNPRDGGIYDPATDSWDLDLGITETQPSAQGWASAIWTGSEMIIWGGFAPAGFPVRTGWRFNPSTRSWTPTSVGPGVPSARENHTAVWTGSEMIVWGGANGSGTYYNTGGGYDPVTDSWAMTSTGTGVPSPRAFHGAVWTGSEMIVWGGTQAGILNSGARYNPALDAWTPMTLSPDTPGARFAHTTVWAGSRMIVWGGAAADGTNYSDGGRYDPATDSWTPTSAVGAPQARGLHTAVWTGTEMIVWGGGGDAYPFLYTGGRYDPATDSWFPTSTQASPGARYYHTSLWTGTEMIVWGGTSNFFPAIGTGFRYEPATSSWTLMNSDGAPSARSHHSAIWTGTEMIVWGGYTWPADTGGRYNPATDGWSSTSASGAVPEGRYLHAAIWTGTEMVVWGGISYGTGESLASGARYDPLADGWTSVNGVNAPSARSQFTAVWTGIEMIIWGGGQYPNYVNTGGRYDPSGDSWIATSLSAGVPTPRTNHTAVWTGDRMIVWGGGDTSSYVGTGAIYDPSTDAWTPMAPSPLEPRNGHTAEWTGHEMIVFGGRTNSGTDAVSHGRYNPSTDSWSLISNASPVHLPRVATKSVWTGEEMYVVGGVPAGGIEIEDGARYCRLCGQLHTYYRDADGDRFGDATLAGTSCDASPPVGFVENASDCSDLNSSTWSVPPEVQDLRLQPNQPTTMTWDDQALEAGPGTTYDVVAGSLAGQVGVDSLAYTCLQSAGPNPFADARAASPPGSGVWYLVRGRNACGVGTFGTGSLGLERDSAMLLSP